MNVTIHIDGAARGNPGPAAFAYVITPEDGPSIEESGRLGSTTNNVAEYTALVKVLERAARLGARRLAIHSDSELLVRQMNGQYRVKNDDLRTLFEEAKRLCGRFDLVTIRHVPRAQNSRADELCNEALDERAGQPSPASKSKRPSPRRSEGGAEAAREEAVRCLRAAATCWADGGAARPTPEEVWDQLWSILEEHGVTR
jgi:ribonuclease HI